VFSVVPRHMHELSVVGLFLVCLGFWFSLFEVLLLFCVYVLLAVRLVVSASVESLLFSQLRWRQVGAP